MTQLSDVEIDKRVKITGTDYDRRRKLTVDESDYAHYLYNVKKYSLSRIAKMFKMSTPGIMWVVDDEYRSRKQEYNRNNRSTGMSHEEWLKARNERVEYKKELLREGKVTIR